MFRHVLPNAMVATMTFLPFILIGSVTTLTALDFLGFGLPPGSPSLGELLAQGKANLQAPWLGFTGFFVVAIMLSLLDLHRRGGARRLRSAQDVQVSDGRDQPAPARGPRPLGGLPRRRRDARGRQASRSTIERGETLALVGESGSGKSVTRAVDPASSCPIPTARHPVGQHPLQGAGADRRAASSELREVRGNDIAMIFQEPMTSLNPLHTIEQQIDEMLQLHKGLTSDAGARKRTLELLTQVGIPEPETRLDAYPHQLSGGQRQRVMIAMALANEPDLLIADEPTTALDVTVQAQILELLAETAGAARHGAAVHHPRPRHRAQIADRVCVMSQGEIVEQGPVEQVFDGPAASLYAATCSRRSRRPIRRRRSRTRRW